MIKKELYAAPETEVLELRLEESVLQTGSPIPGSPIPTTENPYDGVGEDW